MNVELLTAEHFKKFHGTTPPCTVKGIAVTDGDEVFGICCISVIEGSNFIICGSLPEIDKRAVVKGWGIFSQMLREDVIYYALIDEDLPSAPGFLKHFGFEPYQDNIYIYRGR